MPRRIKTRIETKCDLEILAVFYDRQFIWVTLPFVVKESHNMTIYGYKDQTANISNISQYRYFQPQRSVTKLNKSSSHNISIVYPQ